MNQPAQSVAVASLCTNGFTLANITYENIVYAQKVVIPPSTSVYLQQRVLVNNSFGLTPSASQWNSWSYYWDSPTDFFYSGGQSFTFGNDFAQIDGVLCLKT
jgi:hypothetical protein